MRKAVRPTCGSCCVEYVHKFSQTILIHKMPNLLVKLPNEMALTTYLLSLSSESQILIEYL